MIFIGSISPGRLLSLWKAVLQKLPPGANSSPFLGVLDPKKKVPSSTFPRSSGVILISFLE